MVRLALLRQAVSSVDLAVIRRPQDSPIHLLEEALRCRKCSQARWRPRGILHQLAPRQQHSPPED